MSFVHSQIGNRKSKMISLTCTHCKTVLTIDDAFAGGACRCQHCGTIQTVPTKLKGNTTAAATSGKALYRNKARGGSTGTGLDDLADAVLSSGLSSSRLRQGSLSRKQFLTGFFTAMFAVIAVSAAVVYFVTRSNPTRADNSNGQFQSPAAPAGSSTPTIEAAKSPAPKSPNFCGIPLDGQLIVYVLDRGDSSRDVFGDLKQACYKSIATLGPQRKFQVIFWNNGTDDSFPTSSPTFATSDSIEAAKKTLDDIAPHGKTDITSAFTKAIAAHPNEVIIATAKAWDLDDSFVTSIQGLRGGSSAKVHTVALSDPGASTALKRIAQNSGGEFRVVGEGELKDFGQ